MSNDLVFSGLDPEGISEPSDNAASEIPNFHTSDLDPPGQTSNPPTITERGELRIIIISPDGTMTYYDEGGNITAEVADTAYNLWLSENAALDKPFANYSVSEALLLFIAIGSIVGLICKVFKRRKL